MTTLYNTLKSNKKERFAIILEPLQAMLQLAFLSFSPLESKLTIHNNILYIQAPNWSQGVIRNYYNDSKNDLFYLFNIFPRFNKFYQHLKKIKCDNDNGNNINFFNLLKDLASKGIDNLLQTYKQTDNPALLHTLNIYKTLLNNPEQLSLAETPTTYEDVVTYDKQRTILHNTVSPDIDGVFCNIINLYTNYDLIIIFNTLQLIVHNPTNYVDYSEGLNKILQPINKQIQKWIVDNIVY
jgi:hypothetical protein